MDVSQVSLIECVDYITVLLYIFSITGKQTTDQSQTAEAREMALNESWDNIAGDLSAMLQDREDIPDNVIPFDAASEQPIEEQR